MCPGTKNFLCAADSVWEACPARDHSPISLLHTIHFFMGTSLQLTDLAKTQFLLLKGLRVNTYVKMVTMFGKLKSVFHLISAVYYINVHQFINTQLQLKQC